MFKIHDKMEGGQPKEGRWVKKADENKFSMITRFYTERKRFIKFLFLIVFLEASIMGS